MPIGTSIEWIKMMLRSDCDSATEYDLRGDAGFLRSDEGIPIMNMGFWRDVGVREENALWKATIALFDLVGDAAEITERDERVLDAGCGFGTNTIRCVEKFGARGVIGLNVSSVQLDICRRLVAARGFEERITFHPWSATETPLPGGHIDKVVSIEAAFHFATRRDFFREAFRVLKPGGALAIADFIAPSPQSLWERGLLVGLGRSIQMPRANVYGVEQYRRYLEDVGFDVVQLRSIRDAVLPAFKRWLISRAGLRVLSLDSVFMLSSAGFFAYPWEYVLVKARKPA